MCEPVSLTLAAGAFGAVGSLASGIMGARSASMNAQALEDQAALRIQKGEYDALQAQNKFRRTFGQAVAGASASGVDLQSFGDVFADMTMESAMEQKAIRFGAANDAKNLRAQSEAQVVAGQAALIGGVFGAAGKMAGAGADAFKKPGSGYGQVGYNKV